MFDLSKVTKDEIDRYERYKQLRYSGSLVKAKLIHELYHGVENRAVRHLASRYPKNFIDVFSLPDEDEAEREIGEYIDLLNLSKDERPLQKFFTDNPHIICSLLKSTNYGHHHRYVFPEFQISNRYRPDFVLCGTGSDGYGWMFVELQSPDCKILLKNNDPAEQAREGMNQIKKWQNWFRDNIAFAKDKKGLDMEDLHPSRMDYILIIGRRQDYRQSENEWRDREVAVDRSLKIMSYDRIIDFYRSVVNRKNY